MQKSNSLKEKLRSGKTVIGSWITLAHPAVAEIMAKAGFSWLAVDLEHSVITIREAEELIRVIEFCGTAPLVRLSSNDPIQIKRVMDAGAHGIIVPMVNSRLEAEEAVKATKYPPKGNRGVGLARAQGYGNNFEEYRTWVDENPVVIVQIEHIDAVKNMAEILKVEGVDGYIVGPYDLSGSLGITGELDHPLMLETMKEIHDKGNESGKCSGIHIIEPEIHLLKQSIDKKFRFIAYSLDIRMLDSACRKGISSI